MRCEEFASSARALLTWRGGRTPGNSSTEPITSRVRDRIKSDSNSATMASTVNSSRPTGSERVMNRPADIELHAFRGQLIDDVARIAEGPSQTIQLRHNESVALTARGTRDPKAWAFPVGAGQAMIGADIPVINAQLHDCSGIRLHVVRWRTRLRA